MNFKPLLCAIITYCSLLPLAYAQGGAPVAEATEAAPATLNSGQLQLEVDQLVAQLNNANPSAWFGSSIETVDVGHGHSEWGQHRVIAFQRASAGVENNYLQASGQQIATERLTEYFSDAAFEAQDFDWTGGGNETAWRRMFNKAVALTEAQLDRLLQESGVSPDDFAQMTEEQKQVEFRQSFQRTVARESFGNLSGMITIRTYEGFDEDGNYRVAVVSGVSDNMRQIAHQALNARGDVAPSPERRDTFSPIVNRAPEEMVYDFGVRKLYDQDGYPVLASFGQWAVSYDGENSRRMSRRQDHAYRQAEIQADAALAEFIRSRGTYTDASEISSVYEDAVIVDENNQFRAEEGASITDVIRERSGRNANVNVTGITSLRRWHTRHPQNEDQVVVGVVRYWSPVNESHMRDVQNWQPERQPSSASESEQDEESAPQSTIQGSDTLMDIHDF